MIDNLSPILFYINFLPIHLSDPTVSPFTPFPPLYSLSLIGFDLFGLFHGSPPSLSLNSRFLTIIYLICWDFLFSFFSDLQTLHPFMAQMCSFKSSTLQQACRMLARKQESIPPFGGTLSCMFLVSLLLPL